MAIYTPGGFEPPRLHRQRVEDTRMIAVVYGLALMASLAPWWLVLYVLDDDVKRTLAEILAGLVYMVVGGLAVAVTAHRISGWPQMPAPKLPLARIYTVPLWPATVGVILLRLVRTL